MAITDFLLCVDDDDLNYKNVLFSPCLYAWSIIDILTIILIIIGIILYFTGSKITGITLIIILPIIKLFWLLISSNGNSL